MFNIGCYAFADEASPALDKQIAALKRNGMQGVEIRNTDGVNVSSLSAAQAKEIRQKLNDNGLIVWSVGSPIGKIDIEKDDWNAHLDLFKHTLEITDLLGTAQIRMFSFYHDPAKDPALFRNENLDRLNIMAELAKKANIQLCHENEKGIYGDNAERCLDVLENVPGLKAIFDPANFVQCKVDTLRAWEMLSPYVSYMHIKDALATGQVVPAGHGIGHVPEILHAFLQSGHATGLTVEPHLFSFGGLSALEREEARSKVGQYGYETSDDAFDAACNALRVLLEKEG